MVERAMREIGDENAVGRDPRQGLERGFRPVPGGADHGRLGATGRGGLHAAGHRGRPHSPGQVGGHVARRRDEMARQVKNRVEPILRGGAAQNLAAPGTEHLARKRRRRRGRSLGRVATLARVT